MTSIFVFTGSLQQEHHSCLPRNFVLRTTSDCPSNSTLFTRCSGVIDLGAFFVDPLPREIGGMRAGRLSAEVCAVGTVVFESLGATKHNLVCVRTFGARSGDSGGEDGLALTFLLALGPLFCATFLFRDRLESFGAGIVTTVDACLSTTLSARVAVLITCVSFDATNSSSSLRH